MSKLEMEIYGGGVQFILAWADEEQYRLGKEFLANLGALFFEDRNGGKRPDSVYLKSREDVDALFEFRQSLREKRQTGG